MRAIRLGRRVDDLDGDIWLIARQREVQQLALIAMPIGVERDHVGADVADEGARIAALVELGRRWASRR